MNSKLLALAAAGLLATPAIAQTPVHQVFPPVQDPLWYGSAVDALGSVGGELLFLVGAPLQSAPPPSSAISAGAVYAYSAVSGELAFSLSGNAFNQQFGSEVAGLGDVNGDGVPDFAVSSPLIQSHTGAVDVYSGANQSLLFGFTGQASGDMFGRILDGPGDVDGDGVGDVLAGSQSADELRLISGASGATHLALTITGTFAAAGIGDVNGDGRADFAVARHDFGSKVTILSGASGAVLRTIGPAELQPAQFDGFGKYLDITGVAPAGDVDLDGFPDLVVGLPGDNTNAFDAGRVSIYSAATGLELLRVLGNHQGGGLGAGVAGAGDLDGDGLPDVWAHGRSGQERALRGISSATGANVVKYSPLTAGGGGGLSGYLTSLASIDDVTGDGLREVLVGDGVFNSARVASPATLPLSSQVDVVNYGLQNVLQPLELDAGPAHAGQVYLVLGSLSGTVPGIPIGQRSVPLNLDAYTLHTLLWPNTPPLAASFGVLDAQGRASVQFDLTGGPLGLANTTAHHAFVVLDPVRGVVFASNAMPLYFYKVI